MLLVLHPLLLLCRNSSLVTALLLNLQVPDKDGNPAKYKKKDFKYDVKAGFLRF